MAGAFGLSPKLPTLASQMASAPAVQTDLKAWSPDDRLPIAVLPFESLTSDPESESLAAGLTQDLIAALCRVPELLVIAQLRGEGISQSARVIGCGRRRARRPACHQGSLQVRAGAVRVIVQLVETSDREASMGRTLRSACQRFLRHAGRHRPSRPARTRRQTGHSRT